MNSKLAVLLFVLITITSLGLAAEPAKETQLLNRDIVVENYLNGLESNNDGLISSSAYFLGELSSEEAVIPLMKLLKSSDKEQLRLAAALALLKIGDERGIYAIKKAIRFDESKRVSDICSKFYDDYLKRTYSQYN